MEIKDDCPADLSARISDCVPSTTGNVTLPCELLLKWMNHAKRLEGKLYDRDELSRIINQFVDEGGCFVEPREEDVLLDAIAEVFKR